MGGCDPDARDRWLLEVRRDGLQLCDAPAELRADVEVVVAAVTQDPGQPKLAPIPRLKQGLHKRGG